MSAVPLHTSNVLPDHAQTDHPAPLTPERQEEFVRLLNGTHAMLLRYVLSLVANRHDAEDVLQRASVVMWKRFGTFESGTDFVAWDGDVTDEDLITEEEVVVTITAGGYAKRTKSELYRAQRRGGRGDRRARGSADRCPDPRGDRAVGAGGGGGGPARG